MTGPRVADAEQLAAAAEVALEPITFDGRPVTVTLDPADLASIRTGVAVLITPPVVEFDLPRPSSTARHRLLILGGRDPFVAWKRHDQVLEQLHTLDRWSLERAEPVTFALPSGGEPAPAMQVTLKPRSV